MPTVPPDFEADIRFLTVEEGGRRSPVMQGYRPDIHYDDDTAPDLWMVWPRFVDSDGNEIAEGIPIPQVVKAQFYIVSEDLRRTIHYARLRPGVGFHICEGNRKVASCRVTRLLALHQNSV